MKVFVAGATGAVGRPLVGALIAQGHQVVAMTRSADGGGSAALAALGASTVVVADVFDAAAVAKAVADADPDVVINQLTALKSVRNYKNFDREFAPTNRLRIEANDNLIAAAQLAGTPRFIAQSYGGGTYERTGALVKTESDRLDPDPAPKQVKTLAAIVHLENAVLSADLTGVVLRYANFYGPGTSLAADGYFAREIRKRRLPIVGDGAGVWSFIHVDDAAAATVAALECRAGLYNIADDEPVPAREWIPALARALDAKPPLHVPAWLGRLAAGETGLRAMTQIRGLSNAKARREFGWAPGYPSYREGFAHGLGS